MEKDKAVTLLCDLRQLCQQLEEEIKVTRDNVYDSQSSTALESINSAIDTWNKVINQAPRVLKAVKQQYLEKLVYGGK